MKLVRTVAIVVTSFTFMILQCSANLKKEADAVMQQVGVLVKEENPSRGRYEAACRAVSTFLQKASRQRWASPELSNSRLSTTVRTYVDIFAARVKSIMVAKGAKKKGVDVLFKALEKDYEKLAFATIEEKRKRRGLEHERGGASETDSKHTERITESSGQESDSLDSSDKNKIIMLVGGGLVVAAGVTYALRDRLRRLVVRYRGLRQNQEPGQDPFASPA